MKLKIYTIKDRVVGTYKTPFYMHNEDEVKRAIRLDIYKNKELELTADGYDLYCLGEFDDELGEILPKNEFICSLFELKPANKEV